ncbi:hypothetical protein ACJJTC_004052 [Scirpophaga incertulas]
MSGIDDKWNIYINIVDVENEYFKVFESKINNINDSVLRLLEDRFVKNVGHTNNGNIEINSDIKLQLLIVQNKELRHEIDKKLEEVSRHQTKYENLKKDQKLLSREIKETHEAFLMAKKLYKKYLKIYYTIEENKNEKQTIFLQFFTEAKKESESYSIRLSRDTISGKYQLLSTNPKFTTVKELQERLRDTNDVPEFLCCIRQTFIMMKANKKVVK